jgi:hypothetical protein
MKKFFLSLTLASMLLGSAPVHVWAIENTTSGGYDTTSGGYNTTSGGGSQPPSPASNFQLEPPTSFRSICGLIKALLNAVLTLGVPIAVFFLIWAGFKFVVARGSPDGIKKARTNIVNVFIGIAIFLGAWFLGQVIANTLNSVTGGAVSGINSCT